MMAASATVPTRPATRPVLSTSSSAWPRPSRRAPQDRPWGTKDPHSTSLEPAISRRNRLPLSREARGRRAFSCCDRLGCVALRASPSLIESTTPTCVSSDDCESPLGRFRRYFPIFPVAPTGVQNGPDSRGALSRTPVTVLRFPEIDRPRNGSPGRAPAEFESWRTLFRVPESSRNFPSPLPYDSSTQPSISSPSN